MGGINTQDQAWRMKTAVAQRVSHPKYAHWYYLFAFLARREVCSDASRQAQMTVGLIHQGLNAEVLWRGTFVLSHLEGPRRSNRETLVCFKVETGSTEESASLSDTAFVVSPRISTAYVGLQYVNENLKRWSAGSCSVLYEWQMVLLPQRFFFFFSFSL